VGQQNKNLKQKDTSKSLAYDLAWVAKPSLFASCRQKKKKKKMQKF
jgi:hypothetical protein